MVLNQLIWIVAIIVVAIVIIVLVKFLFNVVAIAPLVAHAQHLDEAGSTTIKNAGEDNDTDIHITCTENIEGLVSKCG